MTKTLALLSAVAVCLALSVAPVRAGDWTYIVNHTGKDIEARGQGCRGHVPPGGEFKCLKNREVVVEGLPKKCKQVYSNGKCASAPSGPFICGHSKLQDHKYEVVHTWDGWCEFRRI